MNCANFLDKLLDDIEVKWKPLGEIAEIYGGLTGKSKADFGNGNAKYVSYTNIFNNREVNLDNLEFVKVNGSENQHTIKYGDVLFTGSSETTQEVGMSSAVTKESKETIYLNSFSFGVRFNNDIHLTPEFSKHLFRSRFMRTEIARTANGVTRFNISKVKFKKIQVPIFCPNNPEKSLKIQAEIVRILDTFTELTTELTIELTTRKKQYNYYRNQLLSFDEDEVEWKTLGELAAIGTGIHDTKDAIENGDYIFYARGRKPLSLNVFDFDETAIITAGDGVGVGKVFHYAQGKYALHQRAYRIVPKETVNPRFMYHYIATYFYTYIQRVSVSSSVTSLRRPMFLNFSIPVPPLTEQARIVSLLDKFDTLTNSTREGLPREIALRQKQYEYYRDLLLSFLRSN